jgi:hypothetical protein
VCDGFLANASPEKYLLAAKPICTFDEWSLACAGVHDGEKVLGLFVQKAYSSQISISIKQQTA